MKLSVFPTFLAFLFLTFLNAQKKNEMFFKIIDNKTSEPISYATVLIKGSDLGVIADYNGEFRMPTKYYDTSVIIISSIGYRTSEIPLNSLTLKEINIIKINPQTEALDVVVVNSRSKVRAKSFNANQLVKASRRMTANEIVRKAIDKIPVNLSDKAHSYIGYYRDYQLVDNEFHNLNEAIFETFDKGIHAEVLEKNQVNTAIYSFKQNTNFAQDTSLTSAYNGTTKYIKYSDIIPRGGNEYTILNIHNPVRNYTTNTFSYVHTLERDFLQLHDFRRDQIVYLDDEPLALITFKNADFRDNSSYGLKTQSNSYVFGSVYISLVDYSIHRFNYKVFLPETKNVLFNVSLEYARQDNHMYLNYITFNNAFVKSEDYELREETVQFDNTEQAFYITFNNTEAYLDSQTLTKDNFKFKLGKKRLKTVSSEKISERVLKVVVRRIDGTLVKINEKNIDSLSYTFKRIKDVTGRTIYEAKSIEGDQFREFFVQRVHLNKPAPLDLIFMQQNAPIKDSFINTSPDANQYWINSPLMDKKYRDKTD